MKDESRLALESLGMDIQQTLSRFVGNEGLLFKFLGRFEADQSFAQMTAAIEAGDTQQGFYQAHTLKGVVGNLGLGTLFDSTDPLVEALRSDNLEEAKQYYPPVAEAYQKAIDTLKTISEIP